MNTVKSWKRKSQNQKIKTQTRREKIRIHNWIKGVNRASKKKKNNYWKINIIKNQKSNRKLKNWKFKIRYRN